MAWEFVFIDIISQQKHSEQGNAFAATKGLKPDIHVKNGSRLATNK